MTVTNQILDRLDAILAELKKINDRTDRAMAEAEAKNRQAADALKVFEKLMPPDLIKEINHG